MLKRLGRLPRFMLSLAGIVAGLAVTAGLWLWVPFFPKFRWTTPAPLLGAWLSSSGRTLVAVHEENVLTVWDVSTGQLRARLSGLHCHPRNLPDFWMSPDDQLLAYPFGSHMRFWDLVANQERYIEPFAQSLPWTMLGDGETLVTRPGGFFNLRTGYLGPTSRELDRYMEDGWRYVQAAGNRVVLLALWTTEHSYDVAVWDHGAQALALPELQFLANTLGDLEFFTQLDRTGTRLAVLHGPTAQLWDLTTRTRVASFAEAGHYLAPFAFSPHGSHLLLACDTMPVHSENAGKTMQVWDIAAQPPRRIVSAPLTYGMFSPDGRWFFTPASRTIYELATAREIPVAVFYTVDGNRGPPVYSANNKFLVGYCEEAPRLAWLPSWAPWKPDAANSLEIIEVATGRRDTSLPMARPTQMNGPDWGLCRWQGTEKILTVDCHGTVSVWDLPPRRPGWIDYGLPAVFGLLVLLGVWLVWRAVRKAPATEPAPC
jgi:WD40 repeat protein